MEDKKITAEITDETAANESEKTDEIPNKEAIETKELKEEIGKPDKKKVKKLETENAELKKEIDKQKTALSDANDKYLRMIAEYDNFRRRSAKEKETTYSDAYTDVLTEVLPVIDNLERASAYKDTENITKGLEMTLKSFEDILKKLGIKEIESIGKTFDPNLHNAVMHIEDEQYGENEIVEVLQKGYTLGDKVLRYAMVKVAN